MNNTKTIETSAYLMFVIQCAVFFTYYWWSSLIPVSLFFPVLLVPLALGLILNVVAIRQDRRRILIWCITVYYMAFGAIAVWDWIK